MNHQSPSWTGTAMRGYNAIPEVRLDSEGRRLASGQTRTVLTATRQVVYDRSWDRALSLLRAEYLALTA